jgi:hypothetical protein
MKLKFFFLLLLSLYIVNCTFYIEAQATIRFVSKTGTSTPPYTSWETAADSIQKCINICVDGDTIYVANGIYKENLVINTAISLIGSSMDSTVIDGTGLSSRTVDFISRGEIQNFKILSYGIGSGWAIRTYKYLKITDCYITQAGLGIGGISSTVKATNLIMHNITKGFSLSCVADTCENLIKNCVLTLYTNTSVGVELPFAGNNIIQNNIMLFLYNDNFESSITVGYTNSINISNNLISRFGNGIFFDTVLDTAFVRNNIITYQSGNGSAGIWSSGNKIFTSNQIYINSKKGIYQIGSGFVRSDYNLFWNNDVNLVGTTYGDSDIVADPMFVNDTIPIANGSYDFHLQKYSPAIDKGDPAILDVDGSRSDIGLFGGPLGESYTYQDLAPKPPRNLTASMDSGLVHLKWNKNTEADIFRYRVYRDTVPDFIYDTTKIIAVLSDTVFYDDPPQKFISGNYYYKITAIDSAYHQSPASEEAHINIAGIPEAPPIVVEHYSLLQNYPNPFNPSTTIPYRLNAPGYVKVMVYNLLGELVKVLVNKYQSAGYYEVLFHPTTTERQSAEGKIEFETGYGDIVSGIYLYRIEVIGEGNIPVFTDMKKMMMIK